MADKIVIDYRRTDERRTINHPYWISSGEIDSVDYAVDETECGLLMSFPAAKYGTSLLLVRDCFFQVTELFAGGTITVELGTYTLATEIITTGGVMTIVDADDYIKTGDITYGTVGVYWPASSDFLAGRAAGTSAVPTLITPADATVPAVGCYLTNDGTSYTTGKGRFHMLVSEVPVV